jgi:hypothetical protein
VALVQLLAGQQRGELNNALFALRKALLRRRFTVVDTKEKG